MKLSEGDLPKQDIYAIMTKSEVKNRMSNKQKEDFNSIVQDIIDNQRFNKLKIPPAKRRIGWE